jgi:DNA-binding MarR family transcriptional regulator
VVGRRLKLKRAVAEALRSVATINDLLDAATAESVGICLTDMRCLDYPARYGPVPGGRLGNAVGLTSGALTIAIDCPEPAGFVERRPDRTDRRRVLVALAPAAEQVTAIFAEVRGTIERRLSAYSDADLELLRTFLQDLSRVLTRQAESMFQRAVPHA